MPDHSTEKPDMPPHAALSPRAEAGNGAEVTAPHIISLGKKKTKAIKQLKRGKGGAMDEVMGVVEQVQENLGEQAAGKVILPVVVIYRKKQRRLRRLF